MKRITAIDVPGLYCDDITFCYNDCDLIKCPRNSKNIRDTSIPHSYSMDMPADCPKASAEEVSDSKAEERNGTTANEKVIEGLVAMREFFGYGLPGQTPVFEAYQNILTNAIALLEKHNAVAPDTDSEGTCTCGVCGETVGYYPAGCNTPDKLCKFCPECGREVKWQ